MANAEVGKLTASIALDVSNLTKGVAKADQQLEQLSTSFQKSQKKVNSSLNSIDTKVAMTAKNVVASIRAQTNQINAQMATQRNLLTKSLNVQTRTLESSMQQQIRATQKLSTAVGVNTSLVSASIMSMNKNVSEALNQITNAFERMSTRSSQSMTNARKTLSQQAVQMAGDLEKLKVKAEQSQLNSGIQNLKMSYKPVRTDTSKIDKQLNKLNYTPTINTDSALSQVKGLENGLAGAALQSNTLYGSLSKNWKMFSDISFKIFVLQSGIQGIVSLMQSIVSPGWQFAQQMETEQVGMSGILSSMTKLNDKNLDWNTAMGISKSIIADLNVEAAKTSATSEELVTTFRALLGPGLGAGMNIDEIKQFTVVGVNAVKSMGLDGRQLVQELRDLVQGGIQAASSTLATALGLTDSDIKAAKQSSEGLFKFLMKRIEGFKDASIETGNTLKGMFDQVKEGYTLAQAAGMDSLQNVAKSILRDVRKVLFTDDFQLKPEIILAWEEFGDDVVKLWEGIKNVASALAPVAELIGGTLVKAFEYLANNFEQVIIMWATWNIAGKTKDIWSLKNSTDGLVTSQGTLNKELEQSKLSYEKAKNAANDYVNSIIKQHNEKAEISKITKSTATYAGQANILGKYSGNKELVEWSSKLTGIQKQYEKLGATAYEAAKYANAAAELASQGLVRESKALDNTVQDLIKKAQAEKQHYEQVQKSHQELTILSDKVNTATKVMTGMGDVFTSVGLIIGLTTDESDGFVHSLGQGIETAGIIMSVLASLATSFKDLVPEIMKAVTAMNLFNIAKAGGIATAIGLGVGVATLGANQLWGKNPVKDFDDLRSRYFDSAEDKAKKNYGAQVHLDAQKALKGSESVLNDIELSDYKEAQKNLQLKNPKDPNDGGKGAKSKNAADKAARNQAKNAYKVLESALKKEKETIKQQQSQLESAYKFDLTSTQDYMQTKFKYDSDIIVAEIKNYEQRREIAKSLGQDSDIETFTNKIGELKESAITKYIEYVNELKDKYKELYDRLDGIKGKYEDIVGVSEKAFKDNLVKEYAADFSRIYVELETAQKGLAKAQEEGNTSDIKAWNILIDKMSSAKQQLEQIVYLRKLERDAQESTAKAQNIGLQAQSGSLDYQLLTRTHSDFQKESSVWVRSHADMQSVIDQYKKAIANYTVELSKANDEETRSKFLQNIVDAKQAIKDLMDEVHPLETLIKDNLVDGLSEAFQSIYWGEKSAKEALQDFAKTFLQTFTKKMFDTAFDEMFNGIFDQMTGRDKLDTDVVTNIESNVTVDMTQFQQDVSKAGITLQEELNGRLIPSLQALNTVIQEILAKAGVTGLGMESGTGVTNSLGGIVSAIGSVGGVFATSSGGSDKPISVGTSTIGTDVSLDLGASAKDLTKFSKGITDSTSAITADTVATKLSTGSTETLSNVTKSTGNSAMPALMAAVTAVSGSLGKFGTVLQTVMMILQIAQATHILGFAEGGSVSGKGTGTSDSIPARLSNGEYVIKASSAKALGTTFLDRLNGVGDGRPARSGKLPRFRYADGGEVVTDGNQSESGTTPAQQQGDVPSAVGVTMNMTFQSLDPETNMKLFNKQYENFKSKLINDIQKSTSMRTAIRGVT